MAMMDHYEILRKIGDGTFGTVYKCRTKSADSNDNLVAIKRMKRKFSTWDECVNLREVRSLKTMKHPNVVLLKEVIRENNQLYLVFEYMEENLYNLIKNQVIPFEESTVRSITFQIVKGLAYIHSRGLFHRDLKPENLLCKDGFGSIKIADFGLSREIDSKPPYTEYIATRWYRAPELLVYSSTYTWSVDIWALGCITGELYSLRPLFAGRSEIDQIFKICQVLGNPDVNAWPEFKDLAKFERINFPSVVPVNLKDQFSDCSRDGLDLVMCMLKWIAHQRPSAKDLLKHRYFKSLEPS